MRGINKMKINMLDCTLRDGGYINEWAFKDKHILKILNALSQSHTDIIECSFLEKGKDKI
jgi:4-hydroxy 2-oxovalerate aldolase